MRSSMLRSVSRFSLAVFLIAGIVGANMTERLEGKYLKSRVKMRIDEGWKVISSNVSGAQATNFTETGWTTTNVPHDMSMVLVGQAGKGNDPGATGWYRYHFTLPTGWAGKKVIVQFDGVYQDSKIYFNGDSIGGQRYGYVSFYYDLTPKLSATGDNVLAVFVDNLTNRRSRWYSGTGIFRHVWLIATDKVYVRNWGTAVTTAAPTAASSPVRVQTDVVNDLTTAQTRTVVTTIYDEAGNALQTASTPITINPGSIDTCVQTLTLTSCKLWSMATPVRYYAYTQLLSGTTPTDDYVSPFGIREVKWSATAGMTVNGASVKLKGACVHSTLVPAGAATPDEMWERAVKELKASGCTSIRTAHNMMQPEFYDICDQVGIMVMDEYCDKWDTSNGNSHYADFLQVWKKDFTSFIERDRNHPSIVMWSVGNEPIATGTIVPYITSRLQLLVPFGKNIDKTRPYTHASVAGWSDAAGFANLANVEDVVGVNYQDGLFSQIHSDNPSAVICGTEQPPYLNSGVPTYFEIKNFVYLIGHHLWTGLDYLGEGSPLGATSGYLDNCVFRKSWFYYQLAQWSDSPMVHVTIGDGTSSNGNLAENWNQSGSVSVVTYTNCESVDLYVNTTKIGTKNLSDFSKTWIMQWTAVPWSTGTIKAVGMKGGVQVAVDSIVTAGPAAKILLKPSKTTLYADGEDVCCIEADVVDANNNLVFSATNPISFTFTGDGRSLGIASGNWSSSESFKAASRAAYHGKVLIVIQSTPTPGTINVTVNSGTLTSASLAITTEAQQVNTIKEVPLVNMLDGRAGYLACAHTPGSNALRVRYRVDVPGLINLSVVSPSGRMVQCLTNSYQKAGSYSTEWNAMNKSGVYFFVLKTNNNRIVRKAVMVQ
jgi:beta-galactosidase